jgi:hypothetical protein
MKVLEKNGFSGLKSYFQIQIERFMQTLMVSIYCNWNFSGRSFANPGQMHRFPAERRRIRLSLDFLIDI